MCNSAPSGDLEGIYEQAQEYVILTNLECHEQSKVGLSC